MRTCSRDGSAGGALWWSAWTLSASQSPSSWHAILLSLYVEWLFFRLHRLCLGNPCVCAFLGVLLPELHECATMTGVDVQPVAAFSLLMRLCFELRPVDNVRGSNIPILMILHVVLQLRSLAGVRSELNTNALVMFLTSSFSAASVDGVHALLRDALKVNPEQVDVADRVAVRCCEIDFAHRVRPAPPTARTFLTRMRRGLLGLFLTSEYCVCTRRLLLFMSCLVTLMRSLQFTKHVQHQPADLNVPLTSAALNPTAARFSWLCRNLRLRTTALIAVIPPTPEGNPLNLTMTEMTSVSATLHSLSESSPRTLPRFCSVRFTQVAAPGNQDSMMEVIHLRFSWAGLHVIDGISRSVISAVERRFLSPRPASPGRDTSGSTGGPSSAGSSHAGGSRPPAAPSGPRGSRATRSTPRRKNKRSSPDDVLPVASSKSIRSLRSQKLQTRLAQAHDAARAAIVEEDARATVVQPHYVVVQVAPMLLWPDGGVAVYAQFPFLLDDSWRTPGLCLSYCRKVLCDPDPRNMGGTYEVIFTMEKADVERGPSETRDGSSVPDGVVLQEGLSGPAGPTALAPAMSQPSAPPPSIQGPRPPVSDTGVPAATGSEGRAGVAATGSTMPPNTTSGGAENQDDRLVEEDLDDELLQPGLASAASPTAARMILTPEGAASTDTADGERTETDAAGEPVGDPPRTGTDANPPAATAAAAALPSGSVDNAPSNVGRDAPASPPSVDNATAAAIADDRTPAAAATARARAVRGAAGPAGAAAAVRGGHPLGSQAGRESRLPSPGQRPGRREDSPGAAAAAADPGAPPSQSAPQGLHDHFLKALDVSNSEMGLSEGQTITITRLAGSPKPKFAMRCAFACPLDLDTTSIGASTNRCDQFIVATYRARPGQAPVPISLSD